MTKEGLAVIVSLIVVSIYKFYRNRPKFDLPRRMIELKSIRDIIIDMDICDSVGLDLLTQAISIHKTALDQLPVEMVPLTPEERRDLEIRLLPAVQDARGALEEYFRREIAKPNPSKSDQMRINHALSRLDVITAYYSVRFYKGGFNQWRMRMT
ncbi:hypothetical protein F5Y11DRAFT_351513 [Daldinia sp. FL1419]|nr:hypothetical protein F5Y11DRAFT_351513 [Daldinia sp. FL1419]